MPDPVNPQVIWGRFNHTLKRQLKVPVVFIESQFDFVGLWLVGRFWSTDFLAEIFDHVTQNEVALLVHFQTFRMFDFDPLE